MKNILIAGLIFAVFALGLLLFFVLRANRQAATAPLTQVSPTQAVVGGDEDEHGCIPSAGYSWCKPKNKCLRIWEEKCYAGVEEEVKYILAEKYDRAPNEVKITISEKNEDFAGGSVLFGEGGPGEGGMFLARREGNMWEVVFDGNGNVDCDLMRSEYGFPDEILIPNFCN